MLPEKARICVCGSRDFAEEEYLRGMLDKIRERHGGTVTIIHGACPTGADALADKWAADHGLEVERFPADWDGFGAEGNRRLAGPMRNEAMAATKPLAAYGFLRNEILTRGTADCLSKMLRHGVPSYLCSAPNAEPLSTADFVKYVGALRAEDLPEDDGGDDE